MKDYKLKNLQAKITRMAAFRLLILAGFLLTISSCMPGRHTARSFIDKKEQIAIMITPPANTFLYYYPDSYTFDTDSQAKGEDIESSHFLKDIDVERATQIFTEALLDGLKKYDIKVFSQEQFDQFLAHEGDRYIFAMAQTEMVESDRQHTDKALIDTTLYRQDFLLRTVERNTWFEFSQVDKQDEDAGMKVLYSTFFTADHVDGRFRYRGLTGEVFYEYSSHLISLEDIYSLNHFAGTKNARYIFDFLLNRYVEQNAQPFLSQPVNMRYLPSQDKLTRSRDDQQFIIMQP
ncbi:MAG: hypothetical protein ACOCYD_02495 [bacterium]